MRLPHPGWWLLVAATAALGAAGIVLARLRPMLVDAVGLDGLRRQLLDPADLVTVRDVVAGLLALGALLAFRRYLYARLASRPGPVEIIGAASVPEEKRPLQDAVLADVRRTLATMSLSAPDLVPNEPSSDAVLDDVRDAADGNRNAVAVAALLLTSLVRIRSAYRVTIQLRLEQPAVEYGITVHVAQLPGGQGAAETVWGRDWGTAAQRAAHVVGAYVIPRSALSRRAPWTAWHGLEMPLELFHRSQLATTFIRDRQYERALSALHDALKLDPQNPHLRIELGQVQEQLGLFLDATATYTDIVAIESWHDRRLWRRLRTLLRDDTTGTPPAPWRTNPNGREALLIARYRMVSRLAGAEQLASQWRRHPRVLDPSRRNMLRDEEVRALRLRLRIWLVPYLRRYLDAYPGRILDAGLRDVADREDREAQMFAWIEAAEARLRHLLQFIALEETDHLIDDYRWSRGRRVPGMAVTQTGLNLMRIWARLYLDVAADSVGLPRVNWPANPDDLDRDIHTHLLLQRPSAQGWTEHYNAACTVAVALRGWPSQGDEAQRRKLELQAVRHLERAVSCTNSGRVGRYAQWLSTGDQDLNPLRLTEGFVDFLDRYLPNPESRIRRPDHLLLTLVMSLHTLRLLASLAQLRARFWASRGESEADDNEVELDREPRLISLVDRYVRNDRHWQSRNALLEEIEDFSGRHQLGRVRSELPQFQDDPEVKWLAEGLDVPDRNDPVTYFSRIIDRRREAWESLRRMVEAEAARLRRDNVAPSAAAARTFWADLFAELDKALAVVDIDVRLRGRDGRATSAEPSPSGAWSRSEELRHAPS